MIRDIFEQIKSITSILVESGTSIKQNFPSLKNGKVSWSGYKNISHALKNLPYIDIYERCLNDKDYNFLFFDYALIQIYYEGNNQSLNKHRLSYMPNPRIYNSADFPDEYQKIFLGDLPPPDIYQDNAIVFPLRFDFDSNEDTYKELEHPYSHLTLGNYSDCRIPVNSPITPYKFMNFILRSFYNKNYMRDILPINEISCPMVMDSTLTDIERSLLHMNYT